MNRILKTAVLSVAVAATTLATLPAANAGERHWRRHHGYHDSRGNDLAVAGILGLAAGALAVGLASRPAYSEPAYREPVYREPAYVPRREPVRRYAAGYDDPRYGYSSIEPWTEDWYDYCADRYRSFKARTGTYTGYDGQQHFCVAN